jgi:hypothetical protein
MNSCKIALISAQIWPKLNLKYACRNPVIPPEKQLIIRMLKKRPGLEVVLGVTTGFAFKPLF